MKIIDAQVHIWSQTVTPTSGLHRKVPKFTAEELLQEMDEAGVDAALIHPPRGWDPDSNAVAVEAIVSPSWAILRSTIPTSASAFVAGASNRA